jgi:hypothetical protein
MSTMVLSNYIVNPFNIFEPNPNATFNRYKKNIISDRITLFYELSYVKPKTLMVGSSRIGYFKDNVIEKYVKKPIFNLSLAGSSVYEQVQYIKYSINNFNLNEIVWSLDFYAFNPDKKPYNGYSDERLNKHIYLDDYFTALMSYRTFERSLKTIKDNKASDKSIFSYLVERNQYSDLQGQTLKKEQIYKNIKITLDEYKNIDNFLKSKSFKDPKSINKKLQLVKEVVLLCKEKNIKLTVYTSPTYIAHLDLIDEMGLTETFKYWKKELAKITHYTDFCYRNDITKNIMNFRDSSHTISDTGKLIFKKIYNPNDANQSLDFGISY